MMQVGGRTLRVATWRLDLPTDHPPLLFFNGIGASIESIAPLAATLPERAFITLDMPGVGSSPEPAVPYTPATMAWTASELLTSLAVPLVDVMGFSWGGAIAQQFALQHCDLTRRLILCATTAGMPMVPGAPITSGAMGDPQRLFDALRAEQYFARFYGDAMDQTAGAPLARLTPPTRRGYLYQLMAMTGWTSAPALPFLRKPVLILTGDSDTIVPPINARILHTLIAGSELATFAGGGHLVLLSHREAAAARMREFLDARRADGRGRRAA